MSSQYYIESAVKIASDGAIKLGFRLLTRITTPMSSNYCPELDETEELNAADTTFYQELIGMLRWGIELGRVDILTLIKTPRTTLTYLRLFKKKIKTNTSF